MSQAVEKPPLWQQPIEVVGLTGEYASGKTLFALSIAPGKDTLIYDTEKSSGTYQSLGFDRVDVPAEMLRVKPAGHKPIDLFTWWRDHVRSIQPGRYRVIVLDTVSEIESGLVDYVRKNPGEFGYSASQFAKADALVWGCVKDFWKAILSDLAARCETFAFTSHLRNDFSGGRPTGKKSPKGKDTLMELASLYLWMERAKDKKGNVPDVPAAEVIKSRLATIDVVDGVVRTRPTLPPRLPIATPAAIRAYMADPPDYAKLKPGERAVEREMTVAEMEQLRLAVAEAERDTESMRLARQQQASEAAARARATNMVTTAPAASPAPVAATQAEPSGNGNHVAVSPAPADLAAPAAATIPAGEEVLQEQLDKIAHLYRVLTTPPGTMTQEQYRAALTRRGVQSARFLNRSQAAEFIGALQRIAIAQEQAKQPAGAAVAGHAGN